VGGNITQNTLIIRISNKLMPGKETELNPISFLTIGTIGPKGKRQFHLQGGDSQAIVSLIIEKEQARSLALAITEMLDDIARRFDGLANDRPAMNRYNMDLREPVESAFRVGQIALGYNEDTDQVILIAQELVVGQDPSDPLQVQQPSVVRFWGSREQFRALGLYAQDVVKQGRADPAQNGRVLYYWT
jgi:uncharacterized repeat protein (TIGR03847 family)